MTIEELKPCPFCGGNACTTINTEFGHQVYCENNNCVLNELIMTGKEIEQQAIAAWNRRADVTPVVHSKWELIAHPSVTSMKVPTCMNCKKMHSTTEYCPYCGAKMDLK